MQYISWLHSLFKESFPFLKIVVQESFHLRSLISHILYLLSCTLLQPILFSMFTHILYRSYHNYNSHFILINELFLFFILDNMLILNIIMKILLMRLFIYLYHSLELYYSIFDLLSVGLNLLIYIQFFLM